MRFPIPTTLLSLAALTIGTAADPLPLDPLWKSESFRKSITGSFGIDSRIEPRITEDEAFYLDQSAGAMADQDRPEAITVLRDSPLLPKSAAMLFSLATLQFEEGEPGDAIPRFQAALELFPNFRDAHRNLAVAYVQESELEKAEEHLIEAVRLGAGDGLTMGLLGYIHSHHNHPQAALTAYRLASLTQPKERQWKSGEASALRELNQHEEAKALFQELIDERPQDLPLWRLQADTFLSLDDNTAAIANLELARRADDLPPVAIVSLGHLLLRNDLPDLALARYEEALTSELSIRLESILPAVELLTNRRLFSRAARLITAIESAGFDLTAEENRTAAGKLTRARALVALETGDAEAGAGQLRAWLTQEPTDGLALILLARFEENAGLREEAGMLLEQAAAMPEHEAAALLAHGRLLVNSGDYATALEKLERSAEIEPSERVTAYRDAVRELAE